MEKGESRYEQYKNSFHLAGLFAWAVQDLEVGVSDIVLSETEIVRLTDYENATKQLNVLHQRGFTRAWINRHGKVVLERAHYEAVSRGHMEPARKSANLTFLKQRA
jgi:hypothetical protein